LLGNRLSNLQHGIFDHIRHCHVIDQPFELKTRYGQGALFGLDVAAVAQHGRGLAPGGQRDLIMAIVTNTWISTIIVILSVLQVVHASW
ncbi:protein Wnt-4, partial [Biomphalaria glabrata]